MSFLEQIDLMNRLIAKEPDVFQMATTADQVRQAFKAKRIASLFGVEGGQAIESTFCMGNDTIALQFFVWFLYFIKKVNLSQRGANWIYVPYCSNSIFHRYYNALHWYCRDLHRENFCANQEPAFNNYKKYLLIWLPSQYLPISFTPGR